MNLKAEEYLILLSEFQNAYQDCENCLEALSNRLNCLEFEAIETRQPNPQLMQFKMLYFALSTAFNSLSEVVESQQFTALESEGESLKYESILS